MHLEFTPFVADENSIRGEAAAGLSQCREALRHPHLERLLIDAESDVIALIIDRKQTPRRPAAFIRPTP